MNIGFDAKRIFHNKTGLGNYSRDTVRLLSRFYPSNRYYLYNPKEAREKLFGIDHPNIVERRPETAGDRFFYNVWRQKRVLTSLVKDRIDLFHGLSGEIPVGLSKPDIPAVVTIHDLIFMRFPQYFSYIDRNIYYRKFRYAAQNSDRIIAISEQTKQDVVRFLKTDERKISVVYQGCQKEFKARYGPAEMEEVRSKFHLPANYVLNVGTVEPRKNLLTLVKALQPTDLPLVVVGSTKSNYAEQVKAYVKEHNLGKRVQFLSGVSSRELAIIYQLADLFVYPSLFEGFGIPVIEALFSGTPVITTQGGCFGEAGGPGALYLENPEDPVDLRRKVELIVGSTSLRQQLAGDGHAYVQRFNDRQIAADLMAVYQETLRDRG